jgi:hypothetical protein
MSTTPTLFNIAMGFLARTIIQKEEIKGIQINYPYLQVI